ncbi:hypothetical protein F5880DRAFT_1501938 [Lentinula raphanica]|nr:hypothetical protein F5880DRAFT_1501938 [Lentinula raphanica]
MFVEKPRLFNGFLEEKLEGFGVVEQSQTQSEARPQIQATTISTSHPTRPTSPCILPLSFMTDIDTLHLFNPKYYTNNVHPEGKLIFCLLQLCGMKATFYGSGSGSGSLGVGSVSSVSSRHSIIPSPGTGVGTGSHYTGLPTPHAHPGYPGTPGSSVPVLVAYAYQLDALYDSDEDDGEDDDWLHDPRVSFYAAVDSSQMGLQGKGKGRGKKNEEVGQSELESQMKTRSGTMGYVEDTMSIRGLGNYFAIWLLLLGLVALFIFYPVLTAPSYLCVVVRCKPDKMVIVVLEGVGFLCVELPISADATSTKKCKRLRGSRR